MNDKLKADHRVHQPRHRQRLVQLLGLGATALLVTFGVATAAQAQQGSTQKVEIEGVIAQVAGACPNVTFTIAGKRIATEKSTRFDDGSCADLANGKKVEIDGVAQSDGSLRATEVDFD